MGAIVAAKMVAVKAAVAWEYYASLVALVAATTVKAPIS